MKYIIQDRDGKARLLVSADWHQGDLTQQQLTIKMAMDEELRENGGVDIMNLADSLRRNGFTVHAFREIQLYRAMWKECDHDSPICPCTEPESWSK